MEKLIVIRTLAQLEELKTYLQDKDFVSYDTETTGLEKGSQIIGYSVCGDSETAYYVILQAWNKELGRLVELETNASAPDIMRILTTKQLIMHNAIFDCWQTNCNFGIDLMPALHADTMIMAHLLDENRRVGLKDLGTSIFGQDAKKEQIEMTESIKSNGGSLTRDNYELYKGDADLIAKYGAKDALLTFNLFFHLAPQLYEQKLDKFFYEDESMPLLRGPTYDLNTTGLKVDPVKLQTLRNTLEADCAEAKAFIYKEIEPHVKKKYPGTGKTNKFNINASKQLAWLLFFELDNEFLTLTKGGREVCKFLGFDKLPYTMGAKSAFVERCAASKGAIYADAEFNPKTGKMGRPKKIGDPWNYVAAGKESLSKYATKYKWVAKLLEYKKNDKLLNTYVDGIQAKMKYGIIHPSFLQHGTTSGRYSSRHPNFQNLPRDDKRIKACIVARPGKVFVGADYSQLEPRVFASVSQDENLMGCFARGEDFYSVVGAPIFGITDCSLHKNDENSFAKKYPKLRDRTKIIALATPYGRTAGQQAATMGIDMDESQALINAYFEQYPKVELMMLESHEQAKANGVVYSLFGRPRRMPEAKNIRELFGDIEHSKLPYLYRNILNLSMNHRVQASAASITNRAAIACWKELASRGLDNVVKIIMQVHDSLILECPEGLSEEVSDILKSAMESTVTLPGVVLEAEPKIGGSLSEV